MRKALLLAAGIGLCLANAAGAAPLGAAGQPVASDTAAGVQLVRHRLHRRYVVRRRVYVTRRAGYPGSVVAPAYAAPYYAAPAYGDHGDPLHRYYTPGLAPNVQNPSVAPSYQNPAVDEGLLYPGRR